MGRVGRAWRKGVRERPAFTPFNHETGSNLADTGRVRRVLLPSVNDRNSGEAWSPIREVTLKARGVGVTAPPARTPGSARGPGKRTGSNLSTAPRAYSSTST